MFKILLVITLSFAFVNAAEMGKSGGWCTLKQEGNFQVGFNNVKLDGVKYDSLKKSGKNFRELFVGSTVVVNSLNFKTPFKATILDYKHDKLMKGKPKTGVFMVKIEIDDIVINLNMDYIFDKGIIRASKMINGTNIWFETAVGHSLCYVKNKMIR